jgi:hypothetical protein
MSKKRGKTQLILIFAALEPRQLSFTLNPNCFLLDFGVANPTHQLSMRSLTMQFPEMNRLVQSLVRLQVIALIGSQNAGGRGILSRSCTDERGNC